MANVRAVAAPQSLTLRVVIGEMPKNQADCSARDAVLQRQGSNGLSALHVGASDIPHLLQGELGVVMSFAPLVGRDAPFGRRSDVASEASVNGDAVPSPFGVHVQDVVSTGAKKQMRGRWVGVGSDAWQVVTSMQDARPFRDGSDSQFVGAAVGVYAIVRSINARSDSHDAMPGPLAPLPLPFPAAGFGDDDSRPEGGMTRQMASRYALPLFDRSRPALRRHGAPEGDDMYYSTPNQAGA